MAKLIGLTGLRGSGKSTAAQRLLVTHGFALVKFAGPLKDMLRVIGLTDEHLDGALKEVPTDLLLGKTPRHAMQTLGTEWGRDCIGRTLWRDAAARRIDNYLAGGISVIIDDLRFHNELAAIHDRGGISIRIDRSFAAANDDLHPSEVEIPDLAVTHSVENDGTVEHLWCQIDRLVESAPYWPAKEGAA